MIEGERCRADALMIRIKAGRSEDFFANPAMHGITCSLDLTPERG
jgi:hypothetical protein